MGLSFCLTSGENLLSSLSFITLKRLLLSLLPLDSELLFELLCFEISDTSFFCNLKFDAPVNVCL